MDSQTTSPALPERPDPLTATLHNPTIDKAEFAIARSYTNTNEYDCITLEKISDLRNILEESSHRFQPTGTPALQGPPDEDYDPVPAMISLSLARELVERILLLLEAKSILKCRLVNREFNAIIQSSTLVQYYLACSAAGVVDNPRSPLSYAERYEALKNREEAWRKLEPVFETTIKAIDQPSTLYGLRAGNYFRGDKHRKDLYCCRLPSSPEDNPQWIRIPGHGPEQSWSGFIIDTGMAVYEHDLVVNIISSKVGNQADVQRYSLDLVLLKFSTGEHHPFARHPLIHVQRSTSTRYYSAVRIVGDNLALVTHDPDGSKLFVFDWKTGHMRLRHRATEDAYENSTPVFLSPDLLLVPNRILSHFEVWHLFPSLPNSPPPVQILSLQIPAVSDDYSIYGIDCHGELSPFLHSMPYFPPRPFFPSSENSIITVNLRLEFGPGFHRIAYKFVMHCCALLDMIQKWISPSLLEQQGLPTCLTNEATVHKVADPDDGSVILGAQSVLVSTMVHPGSSPRIPDPPTLATSHISPTFPTSHISANSSSSYISSESTSATSRYNILQVKWADWGPPISRWLQINGALLGWIYQSTGQRYVFLDPIPRDNSKWIVGVADFNLHNVKRTIKMKAQLRGDEGEDNGGNGEGKQEENEEQLEILDHDGVFTEEVYMGLKCVISYVPGEYDFDGVLMDEERLLGLKQKLGDEGPKESIKVFYFG